MVVVGGGGGGGLDLHRRIYGQLLTAPDSGHL